MLVDNVSGYVMFRHEDTLKQRYIWPPYILILIQKERKNWSYKIFDFINKPRLCQDSASYFN